MSLSLSLLKNKDAIFWPLVVVWVLIFFVTCNGNVNDQPVTATSSLVDNDNIDWDNGYNGFTIDTTKPKPIIHYKLEGTDTLFNTLKLWLMYPDDITNHQKQAVVNWINSSIKPDTTFKK